jgi:hypothetical protein
MGHVLSPGVGWVDGLMGWCAKLVPGLWYLKVACRRRGAVAGLGAAIAGGLRSAGVVLRDFDFDPDFDFEGALA